MCLLITHYSTVSATYTLRITGHHNISVICVSPSPTTLDFLCPSHKKSRSITVFPYHVSPSPLQCSFCILHIRTTSYCKPSQHFCIAPSTSTLQTLNPPPYMYFTRVMWGRAAHWGTWRRKHAALQIFEHEISKEIGPCTGFQRTADMMMMMMTPWMCVHRMSLLIDISDLVEILVILYIR